MEKFLSIIFINILKKIYNLNSHMQHIRIHTIDDDTIVVMYST